MGYESTKRLLTAVRERTDEIIVKFSGGKDSLVILDLCVPLFRRVVPVYLYAFPGLAVNDRMLAITKTRYGLETLRYPAKSLSERLRAGLLRDSPVEGVPRMTNQKLEALIRHDTGVDWFASGERINDSMARRARLKRCNGCEEPQRRVFPIYDWTTEQVHNYLTAKRLPMPLRFGREGTAGVSGLALNYNCMVFLRDNWPQDFEKVKAIFPHVENIIRREEFRLAREKQAPGLRSATRCTVRHKKRTV